MPQHKTSRLVDHRVAAQGKVDTLIELAPPLLAEMVEAIAVQQPPRLVTVRRLPSERGWVAFQLGSQLRIRQECYAHHARIPGHYDLVAGRTDWLVFRREEELTYRRISVRKPDQLSGDEQIEAPAGL